MLRDADAAMYAAKAAGRGGIRIFDRRMHAAATQRLRMERALQDAIAGDEFTLVYQPVVRVDDESPAGFEALLRWRRADRVLAPAGFLALAEETALIVPLGSRAVQLACVQCAAWQRAAPDHPAARVSVNLFARSSPIRAGGADRGGPGRRRTRRVAARGRGARAVLAADLAEIDGTLGELRELGVDLVVDGFGASGAALGRICRRPLAGLKLDRGSVKDLHRTAAPGDRRRRPRHDVAARHRADGRGHPERARADVLRELGCDLAQGHRFARPLAPDAVTRLLTHRAPVQSTIANASEVDPRARATSRAPARAGTRGARRSGARRASRAGSSRPRRPCRSSGSRRGRGAVSAVPTPRPCPAGSTASMRNSDSRGPAISPAARRRARRSASRARARPPDRWRRSTPRRRRAAPTSRSAST